MQAPGTNFGKDFAGWAQEAYQVYNFAEGVGKRLAKSGKSFGELGAAKKTVTSGGGGGILSTDDAYKESLKSDYLGSMAPPDTSLPAPSLTDADRSIIDAVNKAAVPVNKAAVPVNISKYSPPPGSGKLGGGYTPPSESGQLGDKNFIPDSSKLGDENYLPPSGRMGDWKPDVGKDTSFFDLEKFFEEFQIYPARKAVNGFKRFELDRALT